MVCRYEIYEFLVYNNRYLRFNIGVHNDINMEWCPSLGSVYDELGFY